jgi:predicted transposase/invertase (TIGR01784 family)
LIETVVIYKLPRLSREEIQAMLQVHDIRETRVFQEAKEEGIEEGIERERQRNRQEKLNAVPKLAALNVPADKIAEILGLEIEAVRTELARTLDHQR